MRSSNNYRRLSDHPADCAFCEDVQWMAQTGASVWEMTKRLGTSPLALERRLRRHGQRVLAAAVERDQKVAA